MQRIVIVGGGAGAGAGGTMVANILTRKLLNDIYQKKVEVVLISDSEWHYYKPAFMYVAFNLYLKEELRKSQRSLLRPEIQFIHDRVEHFDFASQTLQGKSGTKYGYDYLVIATGCQPRPDRISGMKEAADHFYQYQPARWRKNWQNSKKAGFLLRFLSRIPLMFLTSVVSRRWKLR